MAGDRCPKCEDESRGDIRRGKVMKSVNRNRLAKLLILVCKIPSVGGRGTKSVEGLSRLESMVSEMVPSIRDSIMYIARHDDPQSEPDEELDNLERIVNRHLADWH